MYRSLSELRMLNLSQAEENLLEACGKGTPIFLGDVCPKKPDVSYNIRADVLRYIIAGGCGELKIHENGIRIRGAYVVGELNFSSIISNVHIRFSQCKFERKIEASQAVVSSIQFNDCRLKGFNGQLIELSGSIVFSDGSYCSGEINIAGSKIRGQLICSNINVCNPSGDALDASSLQVEGGVFLNDKSKFEGEVALSGAIIGSQLVCSGSSFINSSGDALDAEGIKAKGGVFLDSGFNSLGRVSFSYSEIKGLFCSNGIFKNPDGNSLNAGNAKVDGGLFLNDGFISEGIVNIGGSIIEGQLSCSDGNFINIGGVALRAQGVKVRDGIFFRRTKAQGAVSFSGAFSGGQLSIIRATFSNPKGKALTISGMKVTTSIVWKEVSVCGGHVDFSRASTSDLSDDLESWLSSDSISLHGLTYNRISEGFIDSRKRKIWLRHGSIKENDFHPQPYTQLAKALREMGHDKSALDILTERGSRLRAHMRSINKVELNEEWGVYAKSFFYNISNFISKIWDVLQRVVVGYGYKPERSFWALAVLILIASFVSGKAWNSGAMVPNSDVIITSPGWKAVASSDEASVLWTNEGQAGEDWETFNKYAWAIDVVVPIVELGQSNAWAPSTTRSVWGWITWWSRWFLSILGWLVFALAASAITGIIKRE